MKLFSVRMLFEIKEKPRARVKNTLYSDSIFLLVAKSDKSAIKRVIRFAQKNAEMSYKNYLGKTVTWKIKKVLDCKELIVPKIKGITEVYSCFYSGWYPRPEKNGDV